MLVEVEWSQNERKKFTWMKMKSFKFFLFIFCLFGIFKFFASNFIVIFLMEKAMNFWKIKKVLFLNRFGGKSCFRNLWRLWLFLWTCTVNLRSKFITLCFLCQKNSSFKDSVTNEQKKRSVVGRIRTSKTPLMAKIFLFFAKTH